MSTHLHTLSIGPTGSGKTTGTTGDIEPGTVILDPHGTMVDNAAIKCSDENIPCVIDCLARTDLVLPWQFLAPITGDDYAAELTRNECNYAFADVVARDQQRESIRGTPLLEEWLIKTLNAWHRYPAIPLSRLDRLLDPMSEEFQAMATPELEPLAYMNVFQQRTEVGAAKRMLSRMSPAFAVRCTLGGWDHVSFLNAGGVICLDGNGLSIDSTRMIMGAVSLRIISDAKRGLFQRPIRLVVDEAGKIIAGFEAAAIEETRKYGLFFHLLDQQGDFGTFTTRVWQNCGKKIIYGCDDGQLAVRFAQLFKTPSLDPYEVHYEESSTRQIHNGYDNVVDPESDRTSHLSRYATFEEKRTHYMSLDNQVRLFASELMTLKQNERYVKEGDRVYRDTFDLFRPRFPFGISQENAWRHAHHWITKFAIKPSSSSATTPSRSMMSEKKSDSKTTKRRHGEWRRLLSDNP